MKQQSQSPGQRLRHYALLCRLNRPAGIWLLLWPCFWGVGLASHGAPSPLLLLWFLIGAVAMRSAGCIVNDMADRGIDMQVARTRSRPLAAGTLSMKEALAALMLCLAIGLAVLLAIDPALIGLATAALLLIAAYPFMKRITYWPQAFLGITFNLGVWFGWLAAGGTPGWTPLWLYLAGICWTIGYDTIYAHQDIEDDLRIGVKSTAIRFGNYNSMAIALCYGLFTTFLALAVFFSDPQHPWIYAAPALAGLHSGWQVACFRPRQPPLALRLFKSNVWLGGGVAFLLLFT